MRRSSLVVIVVIALAATAAALALRSGGDDPVVRAPPTSTMLAAGETVCDAYRSVTTAGTVASEALVETSGIAASRRSEGVIWAHNDSGDDASVYAVGANGAEIGAFTLGAGLAFDWEDLAIGSGVDDGVDSLFIGDIGDNFGIRDGVITVYEVAEPDPATAGPSLEADRVHELRAPDGPHNFEAMFVTDGSIFVATKEEAATRVYRGDPATSSLELIATVDLGAEVTAADVSWDGSVIAFRGYENVWLWHRAPEMGVAEALAATPCTAPSPDEGQGEAIAFRADATIVTISEGENPEIHLIPRIP